MNEAFEAIDLEVVSFDNVDNKSAIVNPPINSQTD